MPKACCTLPPAEYLRECFTYDPISGELRWRERPQSHFPRQLRDAKAWNKKWAGRIAGRYSIKGYLQISVDNHRLYASRIIYKMIHGEDPQWMDHIDRNRANNAADNLRSVSMLQNNQNMRKRPGASGYIGVTFKPGSAKPFYAKIRDERGIRRSLGSFSTPEEAHAAYVAAANRFFGAHSPFTDH